MDLEEVLSLAPEFLEVLAVNDQTTVTPDLNDINDINGLDISFNNEISLNTSLDVELQVKLNTSNAKMVVNQRVVVPITANDVDNIMKEKVKLLTFRDYMTTQKGTDEDKLMLQRSLNQVTSFEYEKRRQNRRKSDKEKNVDLKEVIDMRRDQERRQYLQVLEEETNFAEKDSIEFPNWTFYIPEIVTAYGLYEELHNPGDTEAKRKWLHNSSDKGKVYYKSVGRFKDSTQLLLLW